MYRTLFALAVIIFISCNSSTNNAGGSKGANTTEDSALNAKVAWTREGENEFIDGCIQGAAARLGDTTAYKFCKCVLEGAKKQYPNNMNKGIEELNDSTKVAKYAKQCQ